MALSLHFLLRDRGGAEIKPRIVVIVIIIGIVIGIVIGIGIVVVVVCIVVYIKYNN